MFATARGMFLLGFFLFSTPATSLILSAPQGSKAVDFFRAAVDRCREEKGTAEQVLIDFDVSTIFLPSTPKFNTPILEEIEKSFQSCKPLKSSMSKSGAGLFISGDKKFVMKIDQDESMYDEMFTLALNRSLLIGPSHYPESPDHAALRKQYVLLNPYVFNKPMVMATYKSSGLFGSEYKVSITPHVGTMYKELIERYIAYGISVKGVPYTRTNSSRTFTPGQELEFPEAKLISLIDVKATNNNEEGRLELLALFDKLLAERQKTGVKKQTLRLPSNGGVPIKYTVGPVLGGHLRMPMQKFGHRHMRPQAPQPNVMERDVTAEETNLKSNELDGDVHVGINRFGSFAGWTEAAPRLHNVFNFLQKNSLVDYSILTAVYTVPQEFKGLIPTLGGCVHGDIGENTVVFCFSIIDWALRYTLEKKSGSEEDMKKAREEATLDKIKKEKRGFLRELENGWTSDKWRCYHYDVNNFLSCLRLMPLTKDNKAIEKDQAYAIDKFKVRTGWPAPKSMTCKDLLFWDSKRLGGNESPYCMKDVFKLQTESSHCELQQSKCSCRFLMSLEWRC